MFTRISGATSIDSLASAIGEAEAVADNIIFNFDTPGGDATEISSMAERINKIKIPTVAYVGAMAASAGYWLASATDKIIIGSTGMVGSIGVIATFPKKGQNETVEIISSQSPDKRVDVETEEGAAKMQALIDKMAGIFVADVARYRGVSEEKVLNDFGKGGVLIGADAVKAGMADAMGNINELLTKNEGHTMSNLTLEQRVKKLEASDSELLAHIKEEGFNEGFESASKDVEAEKKAAHDEGFLFGKKAELDRIKGVKAQAVAGYEKEIEAAMFDGETTAEQAAMAIVKAMQDKKETIKADVTVTQAPIDDAPEAYADDIEKQWATSEDARKNFSSLDTFRAYSEGVRKGAINPVRSIK